MLKYILWASFSTCFFLQFFYGVSYLCLVPVNLFYRYLYPIFMQKMEFKNIVEKRGKGQTAENM